MEQTQSSYPLEQPLSTPDQAMFDRVWNRVMAQNPPPPVQSEAAPEPPLPVPAVASPQPARSAEDDQHRQLTCLGTASLPYAPLLREMMEHAHGIWTVYRTLARQAQGLSARQLRALAEDQQRSLRQLNAVYFLLTGERFSPGNHTSASTAQVSGALREMFAREQLWRRTCLQSMHQVEDPCLNALFGELAHRAGLHTDAIRRLLEWM